MYDYEEALKSDIRDYIAENIDLETVENIDEIKDTLYDDLWITDSVTGNASGSYTFNRSKAAAYVTENLEILQKMVSDWAISAEMVAEKFLSADWEFFDVSIRCYLLGSALDSVISEIAG